jgi:hypothetical protein
MDESEIIEDLSSSIRELTDVLADFIDMVKEQLGKEAEDEGGT